MNNNFQTSNDAYVVYHNGPDGKDEQPIFCRGQHFEDMCSCAFAQAKTFCRLSDAEHVAENYNNEAADKGHPLAGKFKIGMLYVKEMVRAEA